MRRSITVGLLGVCLAAAGSVRAQVTNVPVKNFSFEIPDLPNVGDGQGNVIPDWDTLGDVGLYYPSLQQYSGTNMPGSPFVKAIGIPDGKQVAYNRGGFIRQNVAGLQVKEGYQYNLTVDVGQRLDVPISQYLIGLEATGTNFLFARATAPIPKPGFFTASLPNTPTLNSPPSPVASFIGNLQSKGSALTILLAADQLETDFDRVRLTEVMGGNDLTNMFVPKPTADAGSFKVVFQGDVRNNIDVNATAKDELVNPFAYADNHFGNVLGTSTVTSTLDASGNTVVTFSGPRAIKPTDTFFGNGQPHFGIDGFASPTGGTVLHDLSKSWVAGSAQPNLPGLTLLGPDLTSQITDYAIIYANMSAGGLTVGEWFEVPLTAEGRQLCFVNDTAMSGTISDAGVYVSAMQIPLDRLNWPFFPPPGEPGSVFTRLPQFEGLTLQPGGKLTFNAVPEPGAVCSFGALIMAGGILLCSRRRRAYRRQRPSWIPVERR